MEHHGYDTEVHYWNISFEYLYMDFLKVHEYIDEDSPLRLLHFFNYIALQQQDHETLKKIKYVLLGLNPELVHKEDFSFDEYQHNFATLLRRKIEEELEKMDIKSCLLFGISAKIFQLIPGNIIAGIVREISPNTQIVIGGIGSKEECSAIMQNFSYYDYAVWGEGEYALLELFRYLKQEQGCLHPKDIPSLAYRDGQSFKLSDGHVNRFFDMNSSVFPDHSDFFIQKKGNNNYISVPIEGSRGCHWQRCKFCFLNEGYRYRIKENDQIIKEIKHNIEIFGITKFLFLDNDLVSRDIERYENLLDLLTELRQTCPSFEIIGGEIITKGLNNDIIEKMALAGFSGVQIGYESASDSILTKIFKKNSFSSNLLFIKWAHHFSIQVDGLNILKGFPEETDEDIFDSIDNMHFMRFLLLKNRTIYNVNTGLAIGFKSPYFKEIEDKNKLCEWTVNRYTFLLSKFYIADDDRFKLFSFTQKSYNRLWEQFEHIHRYYLTHTYSYSLLRNKNVICYQEFFDNKKIKEIIFDKPIYWHILYLCNRQILSINELIQKLREKGIKKNQTKLVTIINELKKEYLLYANKDCSEIVTVINTDCITINNYEF
jgi:radical SAM superfamily enzyme YgiQ (UPF0313 family)